MDKQNPIFRSLEVIEGSIAEKLTVENIANSIHFSKYYYQRMFREMVGDSVMGYVTKRKLTLAGRELLETDAAILDIALKFGYESHEGFTRSFKAYMGVTPTDYRKHNLSAISLKNIKGKCAMLYSKTTDGIIRELNDLIVHAKDTANYTRKKSTENYAPFWDFIAEKADTMADELKEQLNRVTSISQQPDEISARFLILKALEHIAFMSNITAFNAGLMVSRATEEQKSAFEPITEKYYALAGAAQMKVGKIAEFFSELAALIFEDMRKGARQKIQNAVEKGKSAAADLTSDSDNPYGYIAHEILQIVNELAATPLAEFTVSRLEDYLYRLQIITFAADTDVFRTPPHKALFNGIKIFTESISETAEFFQSIAADFAKNSEPTAARENGLAFQGNILLFYLRGEIQKLDAHLNDNQRAVFDGICDKLNKAIHLAHTATGKTSFTKMAEMLREVHGEMETEAEKLNMYGAAIRFIAEEVKHYAGRAEETAKKTIPQ